MRLIEGIAVVAVGLLLLTGTVSAKASPLTDAEMQPALTHNLWEKINRIIGTQADDGAFGENQRYENGEKKSWYIEGQRYAVDELSAGIARNDSDLIKKGIEAIGWGFGRQGPGGDFPGTGDPFHSTSLFVEAAARSLLLLRDYDSNKYADVISSDTPKVKAAADWLTEPDVESVGQANNKPFTHRRWILAATLAESGELTGDKHLIDKAREYAADGLSMQTPDGINPEKDGYDVSYQAYGISQAERYLLADPDSPYHDRVIEMIRKGLDWELTHVLPSGEVDLTGSTRTGIERGHNGKTKTVDYPNFEQALIMGSKLTGDEKYTGAANRAADFKFHHKADDSNE